MAALRRACLVCTLAGVFSSGVAELNATNSSGNESVEVIAGVVAATGQAVETWTPGASLQNGTEATLVGEDLEDALEASIQLRGSRPQFKDQLIKTYSAYDSRYPDLDMCLAVDGNRPHNGVKLQAWDCLKSGKLQRFTLDGRGRLRWAADRSKCVVVDGDSNRNGAKIQLWDCDKQNPLQKWEIEYGFGRIRWAANPRKCMVLDADRNARGTKVQLWDCDRHNEYQQWCISTISQCNA